MNLSSPSGGIRGYDTGGATSFAPGLPASMVPSASNQNPIAQSEIQRYQAMSPEQLQQLAIQLGASQQGQIVQRVLSAKRAMPQTQGQPQQAQSSQQPQQGIANPLNPAGGITGTMKHGGALPHRDVGGVSMGMADPPWERHQVAPATVGFLHGSSPGRTDVVNASPPGGSYVWPADVLAGLGEGNGLAGGAILEKALSVGPKGTALPPGRKGAGVQIPRPPAQFSGAMMAPGANVQAKGGRTKGEGHPTPILAANGEMITPPEIARLWGGGNLKKGHDLFDQAVLEFRKRHIKDLKNLPGPVKR